MDDIRVSQSLERPIVRGFIAWDQTLQLGKKAKKKSVSEASRAVVWGGKRVGSPNFLCLFTPVFAISSPQQSLVPGYRFLRPSWVQVS